MDKNAVYFNIRKRERERRIVSQYSVLLATPGDLTTGVSLPGQARLAVSCAADLPLGNVVTVNGVNVGVPPTVANEIRYIGTFDSDSDVKVLAGLPGLLTLYVNTKFGEYLPIGAG